MVVVSPARRKRPAWRPTLDPGAATPLYVTICNQLAADIASGKLEPHTKLPTHRDLAWTLQCTIGTITRAYAEAERRGLVHGEVGRGTFVRPPALPWPDPVVRKSLENPTGDPRADLGAAPARIVDLAMNWTADVGADELLRKTLADISTSKDIASLLEFNGRNGLARHREAGARLLARRYKLPDPTTRTKGAVPSSGPVDPERVLIAAGTQHALMVTLAALAAPGDAILVEDLTYPGIVSLARLMRLRLKPLRCDSDGPMPGAFDAACRAGDARALYLVPVQHNPTGRTIGEQRRRELARIAAAYDLPVIEDDIYGYFPTDAPLPIAAFAPDHVIHLAGLSKAGAPGLRIGFLHAPPKLIGRLAAAMAAASWTAAPLAAEVAARWIDDGTLEEVLRRKRVEARKRFELAAQIFRDAGVAVRTGPDHVLPPTRARETGYDATTQEALRMLDLAVDRPGVDPAAKIDVARARRTLIDAAEAALRAADGGGAATAASAKPEFTLPVDCFHGWLKLPEPWRARDFAAEAEQQGVRVTPADAFVGGRVEAPHAVRLCLGNAKGRDELRRGLRVLAQLLSTPLGGGRTVV
ncbi:MAG: PLP-dependent aminotransferase family protein [Rhodospirillales bacterium]|nr:MAG: PLP-dependent aminotransferase family protein [Rhodospirillales bacterium]